jgi:hypothetical protein
MRRNSRTIFALRTLTTFDGDQLLDDSGPRPRFGITFRGYDRYEVDSWLRQHDGERSQAKAIAQATHRAQVLEARLSELEREAAQSPLPETLAGFVLTRTRMVAEELPEHVTKTAEADREAAEKATKEAIEWARERSAQIVDDANRDRQEAVALIDEARKQLELFREQAGDTARERVRGKWVKTTDPLTEMELKLAQVRARREELLAELAGLEESLEASRALLRERGADERVDSSSADDRAMLDRSG